MQYQERIENQIAQLDEVRRQEKSELRERLTESTVSIEDVIRGQSFDGMLGRFAQQLANQVEQVRRVVDQRRQQLQEAEKAVRVLEKLREKTEDLVGCIGCAGRGRKLTLRVGE
jgi:flagellar export protein FliJ